MTYWSNPRRGWRPPPTSAQWVRAASRAATSVGCRPLLRGEDHRGAGRARAAGCRRRPRAPGGWWPGAGRARTGRAGRGRPVRPHRRPGRAPVGVEQSRPEGGEQPGAAVGAGRPAHPDDDLGRHPGRARPDSASPRPAARRGERGRAAAGQPAEPAGVGHLHQHRHAVRARRARRASRAPVRRSGRAPSTGTPPTRRPAPRPPSPHRRRRPARRRPERRARRRAGPGARHPPPRARSANP